MAIILLLLIAILFGGLYLFFGCLSSILAVIILIAIFMFAAWLAFYAILVLLIFYLIYAGWTWLLEQHPTLSQRLGIVRINDWIVRNNRGQTKQNVIILLICVLIIIWLIRR